MRVKANHQGNNKMNINDIEQNLQLILFLYKSQINSFGNAVAQTKCLIRNLIIY